MSPADPPVDPPVDPSVRPAARTRGARAVLGVALIAEAAVFAVGLRTHYVHRALWTEAIATALFLLALVALARSGLSGRRVFVLILGAGLLMQVLAVGLTPASSDDAYRYGWDAKIQLAGIDPYRYTPADHELDRFRTATLFPDRAGCTWNLPDGRCSLINRPTVHTIYPPVAEAAYVVARLASFGRTDGVVPMQVMGTLGSLLLGLVLARRAPPAGDGSWTVGPRTVGPRTVGPRTDGPWTVALWSWCPVTVVEIANNAHIDWLAALLCVPALLAVRTRAGWAGALVGAAIVTKLYPGLLLASMLRRHPLRVLAGALAVVVLSYVPHVLAVGTDVIGFLPGYLKEEGYDSGGRFQLLSVVLPTPAVQPVGAVLLLLAGLWALRRTNTATPQDTAVVVMGIALLIATPSYAWYMLPLLGLVALSGRIEWLPLVLAGTFAFLGAPLAHVHGTAVRVTLYSVGGAFALAGTYLRQRRSRHANAIAQR